MRVVPLNEVSGIQPGFPIEAVGGILVQVGDYKTGTGQYGPWTIQNVTLADGDDRLKVKVTGHPEIDKRRMNRKLYFLSGMDRKGGTAGLKVELETYNGVTSTIVKVTGMATISESWPGEPAAPISAPDKALVVRRSPPDQVQAPAARVDDDPFPNEVPANIPTARQPEVHASSDTRHAWSKFDRTMNKLRRLRIRTLTIAHKIAEDSRAAGIQVDAQHVEKIDSWLAIEACRNGLVADIPDCDPPAPKGAAPEGW